MGDSHSKPTVTNLLLMLTSALVGGLGATIIMWMTVVQDIQSVSVNSSEIGMLREQVTSLQVSNAELSTKVDNLLDEVRELKSTSR